MYYFSHYQEDFEKPGVLFEVKTGGRLESQHIAHMGGFQPTDNVDIRQKNGFAKLSANITYILVSERD